MTSRCPSLSEVISLLQAKAELAKAVYGYDQTSRRVFLRRDVLIRAASKLFNRLQRLDYSVVPDETAIESYRRSVPALLACRNLHFRKRGKLRNEVVALYGAGGVGKSTLAYYVVDTVGGVILTPEDDYAKVLYNLFYYRRWVPVLVFDDIAAVISKYWVWGEKEERLKVIKLFKVLEYSKDIAGLLLLTARHFEGVAKRFRELATLSGRMKEVVVGDHVLLLVEWFEVNSEKRRPVYIDILFPGVDMPEDYFSEHLEKRRAKALEILSELMDNGGGGGQEEDSGHGGHRTDTSGSRSHSGASSEAGLEREA